MRPTRSRVKKMDVTTKSKLENLIPCVYEYFRQNKPQAGVMDFASMCGEVLCYMTFIGVISSSQKSECVTYTANLIGVAFRNGLPEYVLSEVRNQMSNVSLYSDVAKRIYSNC